MHAILMITRGGEEIFTLAPNRGDVAYTSTAYARYKPSTASVASAAKATRGRGAARRCADTASATRRKKNTKEPMDSGRGGALSDGIR